MKKVKVFSFVSDDAEVIEGRINNFLSRAKINILNVVQSEAFVENDHHITISIFFEEERIGGK